MPGTAIVDNRAERPRSATRCPGGSALGIVRELEPAGYAAVFLPEITGRDALVTLGMFAARRAACSGHGRAPMRSRTPLLTAMGAATVHERSGAG